MPTSPLNVSTEVGTTASEIAADAMQVLKGGASGGLVQAAIAGFDGEPPANLEGIQKMVTAIGIGAAARIDAGTTTTSTAGVIYITDVAVQSAGAISDKVYIDPGTDSILQSCTSSTNLIRVRVWSSYPLVTVGGSNFTLAKASGDVDGGGYSGYVNVTLAGATVSAAINATNGSSTSTTVNYDAPPQLLTLAFSGSYPGSQTELKAGDMITITGTMDKASTGIEIEDSGAGTSQLINFASNTTFTTSITIANRGTTAQLLAARVRAKNAAGAFGPYRATNESGGTTELVHLVKLNNLYPSAAFGTVTYPASQGALKDSETATVVFTYSNLNTVAFDSPGSQLSITNPSTAETPKTVTRIAGNYNIATNNLRVTATRTANAAQVTVQAVVKIAHTAAVLSASCTARLRSGGNNGTSAQNHTITLSSDQQLYAAPTMSEQSGGGTFSGSWSGGPTSYTRTLQVHDNMTKGTYTWQSLSATNLAGKVTTTLNSGSTYVLGGFVQRNLTFAAFSQTTALNVEVVTYTKLQAGIFTATNQAAARNSTQGNHSNIANTFTVDALSTNPTTIWWNDVSAASSNSGGTAQITLVEETV